MELYIALLQKKGRNVPVTKKTKTQTQMTTRNKPLHQERPQQE